MGLDGAAVDALVASAREWVELAPAGARPVRVPVSISAPGVAQNWVRRPMGHGPPLAAPPGKWGEG